MNNDRNTTRDRDLNDRNMHERENRQTMTRSRSQTGEISNDELDDDAMRRADERRHSRAETGEIPGTARRSDLGAGE